jgi:eukaryotic-like serine/threonine-protein kinase
MSATDPLRSSIGPYRIVARVGAGGMGEVFKGWDPRLERDVAIKLLHPETAADPERQRRLLAEGRAASALNHPNILRVYDADVDDTRYYLVSEWLEGKSLRDELSRGPLPLKRLLDLTVQIADGLAAAHAMGIVHRDIKPENVMLARDGTARIVDFGLARSEPHAPGMAATIGHADTVSVDGGVSGTPAYMSPEQARGTLGDFRTDQFSFGALVYEMATGQNAFRRETMAETLAAVLHDEPRPIADLNPRIPAPVRWAIDRCLAKDPSERYSATDDLARELRSVRNHLSEALAEPKTDGAAPLTLRGWKLATIAAAAAVAGALALIGAANWAPEAPAPRFVPFASASSYEGEPVWSPDGQTLAYTADVDGVLQVFVKRVGDALSQPVTQARFDAAQPFWAHNGERLYFISLAGEQEGLWSVGITGGRPELVLDNVKSAALDPDGSRLAILRAETAAMRQTLWWSSPIGAEPRRETRPPFDRLRAGGETQMRFSRDGQLLVWMYDVDTINDPARSSLFYVVPKGGDAPRQVLADLGTATNLTPFDWWSDNRRVVVALPDASGGNRHLWMADTVSRGMRQITLGHTNETAPAVEPVSGRIAYATEEVDFDLVLVAPDGHSRRSMLTTARNEFDPAWSPVGDLFAFVTDRSGSIEIWARSRDGLWERPIVTASDFGSTRTDTLGSLAFSPDGRTLAYQRGAGGTFEVWLSPVTGGTPVRLVTTNPGPGKRQWRDAPTWSPNGEWIAYVNNDDGTPSLVKMRVGTNESVELLRGALVFSRPAWSPDGKSIAVETEAGTVVRVPAGGGDAEPIFDSPILAMAWRPDSRRLVALIESETPGHFAIADVDAATGGVQVLNPDLGAIPIAIQPIRGFSYLAGQGFLTSLASARSDIWLLEGLQPSPGWLGAVRHWLRGGP